MRETDFRLPAREHGGRSADHAAFERAPDHGAAHDLTQVELAILQALADGAQSKEMAAIIKRSRGTVEFYIRALFLKLNARSRPHLVAQAFRYGVLSPRIERDER